MILYHEIKSDSLEQTLAHGLKRTARGDKGDQNDIMRTDAYLDIHRPAKVKQRGVSRDNNLYAFIGTEDTLVDITNGATIALTEYPLDSSKLLRLDVDPSQCYVSDLDRYDAVKAAIANHESATLTKLADTYWKQLTPLQAFTIGDITRPEVMIASDIDPEHITVVR